MSQVGSPSEQSKTVHTLAAGLALPAFFLLYSSRRSALMRSASGSTSSSSEPKRSMSSSSAAAAAPPAAAAKPAAGPRASRPGEQPRASCVGQILERVAGLCETTKRTLGAVAGKGAELAGVRVDVVVPAGDVRVGAGVWRGADGLEDGHIGLGRSVALQAIQKQRISVVLHFDVVASRIARHRSGIRWREIRGLGRGVFFKSSLLNWWGLNPPAWTLKPEQALDIKLRNTDQSGTLIFS